MIEEAAAGVPEYCGESARLAGGHAREGKCGGLLMGRPGHACARAAADCDRAARVGC